jgi:hypothetical protein
MLKLHLWYYIYNIISKIKLKLYTASKSANPSPPLQLKNSVCPPGGNKSFKYAQLCIVFCKTWDYNKQRTVICVGERNIGRHFTLCSYFYVIYNSEVQKSSNCSVHLHLAFGYVPRSKHEQSFQRTSASYWYSLHLYTYRKGVSFTQQIFKTVYPVFPLSN